MWLFVGLGNPGAKYAHNRHNIGFMVVDAIADGAVNFPSYRKKFEAEISEASVAGTKVLLMKPQTFMNESGRAVGAAAKFYKIPPERIVVFHDELDLKPGEVRVKKGGGNAGHNGLKSIQAHLGTPDFWRVRIGIGHPGDRNQVSNYVLSDFAKSEQAWVDDVLISTADTYQTLSKEGAEAYGREVATRIEARKG
ncbi:MAG: aminoacyl-tRNA hydrolase [Alphaproteobacteria bacterium]|nr:aminoacyl-tRNA hydrolase [Alphaproteobacteria bacterium]